MDGMLSQEEINALLCGMNKPLNSNNYALCELREKLRELEKDFDELKGVVECKSQEIDDYKRSIEVLEKNL